MDETVKKTNDKQKDGRHKLTEPGPGRPKGSTNKFTDLKKAFLDTFEKIEKESRKKKRAKKVDSLFEWATKNPKNQGTFYQIISKMLPNSITGPQGEDGEFKPLEVRIIDNGNKPDNAP